jgi:hypothetical protein
LYSNATQHTGDWLPSTPSANPKLPLFFGQQPLQLGELHEDILKPVELSDFDQLMLLGDNLKAAFIQTLAFDRDQVDESLDIGMNYFAILLCGFFPVRFDDRILQIIALPFSKNFNGFSKTRW